MRKSHPKGMNPRVNTAGFSFNLSPAQKEVRVVIELVSEMRGGG